MRTVNRLYLELQTSSSGKRIMNMMTNILMSTRREGLQRQLLERRSCPWWIMLNQLQMKNKLKRVVFPLRSYWMEPAYGTEGQHTRPHRSAHSTTRRCSIVHLSHFFSRSSTVACLSRLFLYLWFDLASVIRFL